MRNNSTIQSVDRGLRILELLSEEGRMSASAIAKEIGVHQSSASRLLNSLIKAGLVYKPEFRSFALDYGILLFAGKTIQGFPLVTRAAKVCNQINKAYGLSAIVGILFRGRVLYLTSSRNDTSLEIIDDPAFPVHMSSIGRILAYRQGREKALDIFNQGIAKSAEGGETAEAVYEKVDKSVRRFGFLYMRDEFSHKVNAACSFRSAERDVALAVYSGTEYVDSEILLDIMNKSIVDIVQ